jgi:hypothetical protein
MAVIASTNHSTAETRFVTRNSNSGAMLGDIGHEDRDPPDRAGPTTVFAGETA